MDETLAFLLHVAAWELASRGRTAYWVKCRACLTTAHARLGRYTPDVRR